MVRAVLVALLVACSLVGTAIGAPPAPQSPAPSNVSGPSPATQIDDDREPAVEMLGLDSPTRSDVSTQGVDVSTAATVQREAAESAIDRGALEVAFERAEDERARRQILFQAATDVEIATSEMRSAQRDVHADYVNGTISHRSYTHSRATANVRAEQMRADLEVIEELANRIPQFSMQSRVATLRASLVTFGGPVSSQVQSAIGGREGETRVYLAVSPNGSTMSMIDDGRYVRETSRSDLWTPETTVLIGYDQVVARVEEVYSAFNTSEASGGFTTILPDGTDLAAAGLYQINLRYDDRTTTAYLDGDTRNVFHEVQDVRLAAMEPGPSVSETDNGTQLVVNRTFDGGPLRIATFDNSTGTPIDVPVLVGDTRYRTGSDGVVWALNPDGQTRVVAIGETGNVSVIAIPAQPSQIDHVPVE